MTLALFLVNFWLLRLQSTLKSHFELLCSCYVREGGFSWFFSVGKPWYSSLSFWERQTYILTSMGTGSIKTKLPEIMESHTVPQYNRVLWTWDLKSALQKGYSVKLHQAEAGNTMPNDSISSKLKRKLVKKTGPKLGWSPLTLFWPYQAKL